MKIYTPVLVCLFVFSSWCLKAQSELIFVCDSTTREPISFATIAGDTSGFYSHVDGSFPRELLTEEEYRVTCIGYHPKTLKTYSVRDTFFLAPSQVQLDEAVVKGEYETYEIGYHDLASSDHSFVGTNYITAVLVTSTNQRRQIVEEIIIPFNRLRKGDRFTVFLFSVNEKGNPGELIFEKEIHYENRRNEFRLDIQEYGIQLPREGVFLGVSLFSKDEEYRMWQSPAAPATTKIYEELTFLFSHNEWHPLKGFEVEYWNLAVGLTVRPF
ncbi:peptidase associated/transthyretin-like domain-containing protein [Halocola ammonii]